MANKGLAATRSFAASDFGLILALAPLAPWIAWSETMFLAILEIGAARARSTRRTMATGLPPPGNPPARCGARLLAQP